MSEPNTLKRTVDAPAKREEGWWETVKVIVEALIIALVVRTLLFQPFNIPSGSLIPTLLVGDYLFVSKYSYGYSHYSLPSFLDPGLADDSDGGLLFSVAHFPAKMLGKALDEVAPGWQHQRVFFSQPKRGDIIVFKLPRDGETDYIKRLIGLPGDKIETRDNRLYINDQLVPREPAPPYPYHYENEFSTGSPMYRDVPQYRETLPDDAMHPGGVRHEIIEIVGDNNPSQYSANAGPYTVPPGNYFFMGDDRDNSSDSRVPPDRGGVGYVPAENLIGRAEVIFFSVDGAPAWEFWRWPWTVRWNRMFHAVH